MWESPYRHLSLRGLGRFWTSSHLDGSAERRVGLGLAMEGACWGGLTCCMRYWGVLSQALALASVSVAVETLASSCSPEKNAAQSQQLFLPGRHCQGHLRWSCSLLSSPPWRLLVLYPCALQDTLSALGCGCWQPPIVLVLFQAEQGKGSIWWLSGCLGCSGQRLGIASLRRAGFAVLLDWRLWQVHGSFWERRPSLALLRPPWLLVLPGWSPAGSLWP